MNENVCLCRCNGGGEYRHVSFTRGQRLLHYTFGANMNRIMITITRNPHSEFHCCRDDAVIYVMRL